MKEEELKKIEQEQVIDYPDNLPKDNWELIHEFVNKFGRIPKDEDELNVLIKYVLERQNPAWSEEDEDILNTIINHFKVDIECTDEDDIVRWLKFLKYKYTWKPSDEQLNALHWCVMTVGSTEHQVLQELLEQLEKLKG